MSGADEMLEAGEAPGLRSGVKIEVDSKMTPKLRISVYVGTTPQEMQEALDLAVDTLNAGQRKLGQPTFGTI